MRTQETITLKNGSTITAGGSPRVLNTIYYSKTSDPSSWNVSKTYRPRWFWWPFFKALSFIFRLKWEFIDLDKGFPK